MPFAKTFLRLTVVLMTCKPESFLRTKSLRDIARNLPDKISAAPGVPLYLYQARMAQEVHNQKENTSKRSLSSEDGVRAGWRISVTTRNHLLSWSWGAKNRTDRAKHPHLLSSPADFCSKSCVMKIHLCWHRQWWDWGGAAFIPLIRGL